MKNELVAAHWYKQKYGCEPPHYCDKYRAADKSNLTRLQDMHHRYAQNDKFRPRCRELQQMIEVLGGTV